MCAHVRAVPRTKDTLSVDVVRGEMLTISFDITFHRLVCEDVTIDLLDESGAHFTAIGHDIRKTALDEKGTALRQAVRTTVTTFSKLQFSLNNFSFLFSSIRRPRRSFQTRAITR